MTMIGSRESGAQRPRETRRRLLRALGAAALAGAVATRLDDVARVLAGGGDHGSSRRRQRRRARHRHDPGRDKGNGRDERRGRNKNGRKGKGAGAACLAPAQDLQAAIDAASPGATLKLCDGTWRVASTVHIAKNLTLRGAGAGQTILDGGRQPAGGGGVRVLEIAGAAVVVRDLTITNGNAQAGGLGNGGGIAVAASGTLTLQDSSVTNNVAAHDGGGIYVDSNGALTLEGGSVTGNVARYGGGIYSFYDTVDLEMSSSRGPFLRVADNTATINGGGILSWESTVTSDGTATITHNAPNNCQPVAVVPYCAG